MSLEIRRLVIDDWETYRDVRLASLHDAPEAFATTYAQASRYGEGEWRRDVAIPCWVALVDGEPAGLVRLLDREDALPVLLSMWVAPVARGTGASDMLVQAALDHARSAGHSGVSLCVVTSNARAQAFYRRCGFASTGVTYTLDDGRPEIEMACTWNATR